MCIKVTQFKENKNVVFFFPVTTEFIIFSVSGLHIYIVYIIKLYELNP